MSKSASRKLVWLVVALCLAPSAAPAKSLIGTSSSTAPFSAAFKFYVHYANGHYWAAYHNGSAIELFSSPGGVSWTSRGAIFSFNPSERGWGTRYSGSEIIAVAHDRSGTTDRYYRKGTLNLDGTVSWNAAELAVGPADTSSNDLNAAIANSKPLYYRSNVLNGGELRFGDAFDNPTVPWPASPLAPSLSTATDGSFVSGAIFPIGGTDPEDLIILRATSTDPYAAGSHRLVSIKYDASANSFDASWYNVSTLGGSLAEDATTEVIEGTTSGRWRFGAVRDTNGNIHAVYVNRNADVVHYRKDPGFEDASWARLFVDVDQSASAIDRVALSADSSGNLFLFYSKSDNGVYWRRYDGASWGAENVLSTSATSLRGALAPMELASGCTTAVAWAESSNVYFSALDTECGVYYRSIGTRADDTGTLNATQGSRKVTGVSTSWQANNRGRGDLIEIGAGNYYTVLSVESDTELTLTSPFAGSTNSYAFTISRKFASLQEWEDCISNTTVVLPQCHDVANASLIIDDRIEVGIAYKDSVFTGALDTPIIEFEGTSTDALHDITLTADPGNRHLGLAGGGVILDLGSSTGSNAVEVRDEFITVEWLEIRGGSGMDAIEFGPDIGPSNQGLARFNLIHDGAGDGIQVLGGDTNLDLYNNIIYDVDGRAIELDEPPTLVRILNNTVYNSGVQGIRARGSNPGICDPCTYPGVLLSNNISHSNASSDYTPPVIDSASSNNLASDSTGTTHSPAGGGIDSVALASMNFVSTTAGTEDLHITSGSAAEDVGADLSSIFTGDIDGGLRSTPWDIGADDIAATTAVELLSFVATGGDRTILLEWETGSELDNLGFHLYRSLKEEGPYERITASVIPGLGSSPSGAKYRYRDTGLTNGVVYFYKLEDIETTGKTELHGPVSATAASSAGGDTGLRSWDSSVDDGSFGGTALITYGEPSANSMRVSRRGPRNLLVELQTNGFYAEPQEDGTVHITIPDFVEPNEAGSASVPVKRAWLEALAGRKVELVSVQAGGVQVFPNLRPSGAELPNIVATQDGMVRAARRRSRGDVPRRTRAGSQGDGLYWSDAARIVSVGYQGEVKKALLELAPLQWNQTGGQLLLARRLSVRLSFQGRDLAERSTGGARGRRYRRQRSHEERGVVARLATTERGLHGIRYEDVFRGSRDVRASALRLSRQGEVVAFHLEPDPNRFAPGSWLYFLSEGAGANPYGSEAVYELEVGQSGETMPEVSAAPSGAPTRWYWHRGDWEENRVYQAALLEAPDVWLWDWLFGPVVKSYPFEVRGLAPGNEAPELGVWLQGVSDFEADPDHHVRLYVNGTLVHELSWDGKQAQEIEVALVPGLLREGKNLLAIENVGDTGAAYSMVMLDRFAVEYPRVTLAAGGRLEGRFRESGVAKVGRVEPGTSVLDVTESQPKWLRHTEVGADGTLRFRAEGGRSYLVVSPEAVHGPVVRKVKATGLKSTHHQADFLAIGPAAFLDVAGPLVELRRSQGLTVKAISVEDVYAEFGFGETTPHAIQDFVGYAYHRWQAPAPRYVLLLGDATYDFKDHLGTGTLNRVPPLMVITSYLWTASDPSYAAVNGEDTLPDLAIGRLPAATLEEARVMVEKIVAYETGDAGVTRAPVVLVADNPDRAGNFVASAEALASTTLARRDVRKIYLSELGVEATRSSIVEAFDRGASVVSYVGHGGIHLWAREDLFNVGRVRVLSPQPQQPVVLTMNCLNGYFHFPYFNSLAEELLKARDKGAVATFSPSGLSVNGPAERFHEALVDALVNGAHERLGDAVFDAQRVYAATGLFPELLSVYQLLGDPALRLK